MMRTALVTLVLAVCGCSNKSSAPAAGSSASGASGAAPAAGGAGELLRVDAYCGAFCGKLCGLCGAETCKDACTPRCYHGRAPDSLLDGKDPTVALALTQKDLDACLATVTSETCMAIMQGQVPPACYTIKH